jgi:hypothetical protein
LALFAFINLSPLPLSISSVTTTKTDSFTVSGEGKVTMIPDIARVHAGVTAQGASIKVVQQELNKKIKAISDAVKKQGVDDKDIQTMNYSVNPQYDYRSGNQKITGYEASSNFSIKVRNMDNATAVIDVATANGANQVGGISFDVDDKTKVENEARTKAVADAKSKAQLAAKTAGFTLGRVINYNENTGGVVRPMPMYAKADMMNAVAAEQVATTIEPGSQEISVSVSLSYEIR